MREEVKAIFMTRGHNGFGHGPQFDADSQLCSSVEGIEEFATDADNLAGFLKVGLSH